MSKSKKRTFTFEISEDFADTFIAFQSLAGVDERSTAALIRVLIKQYTDSKQPISE